MGAFMSYWAAARAAPQREAVAQHFLELAGYAVYLPRVREHRVSHGRKIEIRPPLFPGYLFVEIVVGWWQARWCPGTLGLVMNCGLPVRVPEVVLDDIRKREVGGLIELPRAPKFSPGDRVRVLHGPFAGHLGLYAGMKPRERVEVLLAILGGSQRVTLPTDAIERAS
jgi:transcriptional antiterminator RfaH